MQKVSGCFVPTHRARQPAKLFIDPERRFCLSSSAWINRSIGRSVNDDVRAHPVQQNFHLAEVTQILLDRFIATPGTTARSTCETGPSFCNRGNNSWPSCPDAPVSRIFIEPFAARLQCYVIEARSSSIFLRKPAWFKRPANSDIRIIPGHYRITFRTVNLGAKITEQGRISEYAKTMGKPFRHIELAMVFRRQFHPRPLPERGRIGPDVDSDIEYTAFQNGHELALGFRVLVVQSADYTGTGPGEVGLDKMAWQTQLLRTGRHSMFP